MLMCVLCVRVYGIVSINYQFDLTNGYRICREDPSFQ